MAPERAPGGRRDAPARDSGAGPEQTVPGANLPDAEPGKRFAGWALWLFTALLGLAYLAMSFSATLAALADRHFGASRLLAAGLGFGLLALAALGLRSARLRERLLDLLEEVQKIFYGPNFRRDRQAVDILVRAMESDQASVRETARRHLARLTDQDFGDDGSAWSAWWARSRSGYRSPDAKRGDDVPEP